MDLGSRVVPLLILVPIAVVLVLANIYPYHPSTFTGWGLLVLLSVPIMLAGEYFGERVLGAPFVARLPRAARMTYAVVILGGVLAALMFAVPLLEGHLAKWRTLTFICCGRAASGAPYQSPGLARRRAQG